VYGRVQSCLARPCRTPPSTSLRLTPLHAPTYPATCSQVCYALSQLASGFYEQRGTSPMSPYFKDVVQALLETVRSMRGQGSRGAGAAVGDKALQVARLCCWLSCRSKRGAVGRDFESARHLRTRRWRPIRRLIQSGCQSF